MSWRTFLGPPARVEGKRLHAREFAMYATQVHRMTLVLLSRLSDVPGFVSGTVEA